MLLTPAQRSRRGSLLRNVNAGRRRIFVEFATVFVRSVTVVWCNMYTLSLFQYFHTALSFDISNQLVHLLSLRLLIFHRTRSNDKIVRNKYVTVKEYVAFVKSTKAESGRLYWFPITLRYVNVIGRCCCTKYVFFLHGWVIPCGSSAKRAIVPPCRFGLPTRMHL